MPRSQLIFRFFRENPLSVGQILQLGDVGIGTDGHQHIPAFQHINAPVPYTQLDVDKRQSLYWAAARAK